MLRAETTVYEILIRYDEVGQLKGGHHIDITRWVADDGGLVPIPILSDAKPLTQEQLSVLLSQVAADAIAGFSALKGEELARRRDLAALREEAETIIADLTDRLTTEQGIAAALRLEIARLTAPVANPNEGSNAPQDDPDPANGSVI